MDAPARIAHRRPQDYPAARATRLAGALRQRLRGEVRFDDGARALYATDASNSDRCRSVW